LSVTTDSEAIRCGVKKRLNRTARICTRTSGGGAWHPTAYGRPAAKNLLNVVSYFPVGVVLENGFLRLQQLDHLAEFLRPDVT
jgi:hypothetical protein